MQGQGAGHQDVTSSPAACSLSNVPIPGAVTAILPSTEESQDKVLSFFSEHKERSQAKRIEQSERMN